MRKMFWGFGLAGVVTLGGVVAAAHHAARHPHSIIGRVLHGASHVAARLNPSSGFGPIVVRMEKAQQGSTDIEGIPDDPVPVEDAVPVVGLSSAPIVIPDDETTPAAAPVREVVRVVQHSEAGIALSGDADGPAAPAIMPPCVDDDVEVLPMPFIETQASEEESEEGPMPGRDELDCREDPHHHHHYSGCPYSGRMYCPGTTRTTCEPPAPAARGTEEASEPPAANTPDDSTALQKVRRFKLRESIERFGPWTPGVDTMEFRPSDGKLYDYGPGGDQ